MYYSIGNFVFKIQILLLLLTIEDFHFPPFKLLVYSTLYTELGSPTHFNFLPSILIFGLLSPKCSKSNPLRYHLHQSHIFDFSLRLCLLKSTYLHLTNRQASNCKFQHTLNPNNLPPLRSFSLSSGKFDDQNKQLYFFPI